MVRVRRGRATQRGGCRKQSLEELLRGELDAVKVEAVTEHLSSCLTCQRALTDLAAGPEWWFDANRYLGSAAGADALEDEWEHDVECISGEQHLSDLQQHGLLVPAEDGEAVGTIGRYQIRRFLGAGGTGVVLQGVDNELSRPVAIKVLAPTLAMHGPARRRFAREGQAVAAVVHENVVAVHHVEAAERLPYLVMQYVDGVSLQDLVLREGPLNETAALRIAAQLADALAAAHDQGLVHRDVKPANILVGRAGQRVWITDFGLARAVDDASLTRTGFIAGTPHYMSPEQARGEAVSTASDLFGMGSVFYFMVTGRPPFRADRSLAILHRICHEPHRPAREVNSDLSGRAATLIDRLLAKQPQDRFSDARAVRAECLRLLSGSASSSGSGDQQATPVSLPERPRRWRDLPAWWIAPLVLLVSLTGLFVATAGHRGPPLTDAPAKSQPEPELEAAPPPEASAELDGAMRSALSPEAVPIEPRPFNAAYDQHTSGWTQSVAQFADPDGGRREPSGTRDQAEAMRHEAMVWSQEFMAIERELAGIAQSDSRWVFPVPEIDPVDSSMNEIHLIEQEFHSMDSAR